MMYMYICLYMYNVWLLLSTLPLSLLPLSLSLPLSLLCNLALSLSFEGLREVQVDSAKEALQLLRIGMSRRHSAATRLNYSSSRSHSIYTIKLVRIVKGNRRRKAAGVNR